MIDVLLYKAPSMLEMTNSGTPSVDATDLDGRDNLYVGLHCVSKERLELLREGICRV